MIYTITQKEDPLLENIFKKSMEELNAFYEIDWVHHVPKLIVVDDRKTINLMRGEETENWLIGWSEGKNIFVINRERIDSESGHKYNPKNYSAFIKHELSHSFYNIISGGQSKPIWLNEGLSIYTSGQNAFKKKPTEFSKFLEFYEKGGQGVYDESGFFVEVLIEKFGKQKLLDLIKESKNLNTHEEFAKFFAKEYDFNLSYDEINAKLI
jgi:hypothetical protein